MRWTAPEGLPRSLSPAGLFTQPTRSGLELVLATAAARPSAADMRKAHKARRAGRASPVLVAALYPSPAGVSVSICGPAGDAPSVFADMDPAHVERIARLALDEPTHHAAARFLASALPELGSPLPGLRNVGLLATHELSAGVPQRGDWDDAVRRSTPLLDVQGPTLVKRLGFGVQPSGTSASLLTVNGTGRAVAVFCDASEPFDATAQRFDGSSPVSHALAVADRHKVDWALLTRGSEIRLYAARLDTGVGRKGRAETFVEANLALLEQHRAGYLHLLFSADALAERWNRRGDTRILRPVRCESGDAAARPGVFQYRPGVGGRRRETHRARADKRGAHSRLRAGHGDLVSAAVRGLRRGQGPVAVPLQQPL